MMLGIIDEHLLVPDSAWADIAIAMSPELQEREQMNSQELVRSVPERTPLIAFGGP